MSDERTTFEQTKVRLEEILSEVKRRDTSLEQSLELLEEGVRLANQCNDLIDQTSWRSTPEGGAEPAGDEATGGSGADGATADATPAAAEPESDTVSEPASVQDADAAKGATVPPDDQRD